MKLVAESFAKATMEDLRQKVWTRTKMQKCKDGKRIDFDLKHEMAAKWQLWCLGQRACQTAHAKVIRLDSVYQVRSSRGKTHGKNG